MNSLNADRELAEIFEILKDKGVSIAPSDQEAAAEIALKASVVSKTSKYVPDLGSMIPVNFGNLGFASIVSVNVGRRAFSQKIANLTWEPDKTWFELFKSAGTAGLSATGVPLAVKAITGAAVLSAPHVLLPIIAIATVAAGLRWSGRVAVPLRAAYLLHHAWKISEYSPDGSDFSVSDLCDEIPTILASYPIKTLSESQVQDDLNQLIGLNCIELLPLRPGIADRGFRHRRCRLLEQVRIKKSSKEYL